MTTQLLSLGLRQIRQPKVIAEVLCGIILGPTLMGRVPGFTDTFFPVESRGYLYLTATIGLVFFLFLVGLEIDLRVIQRNARSSIIISIGAILLPLAIGFAMAVPIYHEFIDTEYIPFGHFALFVAVAYSITAFPVLCRILSELKLLDTTLGIVVLSAGVGNDIVGWTLLALTMALVNAGSPSFTPATFNLYLFGSSSPSDVSTLSSSSTAAALYILFLAIVWSLIILLPVKSLMLKIAHWTGSTSHSSGPSPLMMTASILLMFGSAYVTDIIGVHAIFGAFLAGLAIPHEGGLAIALTEKLEDLTGVVFLPLYFMYSGLSTDLGLLNTGRIWVFTLAIIVTAYFGKMVGGLFGAKAAGFNWRESATVGTLLSCKGLVELIVLNIGLQAGILSTRVFSMFVLEALVLTFFTTPMTLFFYPESAYQRVKLVAGADLDADDNKPSRPLTPDDLLQYPSKQRLTVVLDQAENMPALMTLTRFLQPSPSSYFSRSAPKTPYSLSRVASTYNATKRNSSSEITPLLTPHSQSRTLARSESSSTTPSTSAQSPLVHQLPIPFSLPANRSISISIDALRLIELTDRTSSMLMKSTMANELLRTDPLLNMYRTFGGLHDIGGGEGSGVGASLSIERKEEWAQAVLEFAGTRGSELVLVGWVGPEFRGGVSSATARSTGGGTGSATPASVQAEASNPFDTVFHRHLYLGADLAVPKMQAVSGRKKSTATASPAGSHFVRRIFAQALATSVDVAVYVDRQGSAGSVGGGKLRILLPFFGGPDDRLALDFVVQLCAHEGVSAVIVRMRKEEQDEVESPLQVDVALPGMKGHAQQGSSESESSDEDEWDDRRSLRSVKSAYGTFTFPDTIYPNQPTMMRLESDMADNLTWARHSQSTSSSTSFTRSRIHFIERSTTTPLRDVVGMIQADVAEDGRDGRLLVAVGRSKRLATLSHLDELDDIFDTVLGGGESASVNVASELRKTIGDVGAGIIVGSSGKAPVPLLVLQAADGELLSV
ncbi:hypothetical protein DL93DRAFT_1140461 [Clavulina sp. PMI_390]|nr:hypothetical protein DL93DRAFT_1140461 [Clavulina sp. PMI_390]